MNNYTLSGEIGTIYFNSDVTGAGDLKYLPNVKSETFAYFIQQKLDFNRFYLDAGYRAERLQHKIQDQSFKLARNAQNTTLENRDFDLNSFSVGVGTRLTDYLELKAKYSAAKRAPEINELYSSQPHYSVLAQEEGNQDLKVEKLKAKELTAIFSNSASRLQTTVYEMNFDNYLYLRNTRMSMRNRLPLKYWTQTDTTITGFEVDAAHTFSLQKYGDLSVSAFADLVKNKTQLNTDNTDSNNEGQYFSNMPTNRYGASLTWDWLDWSVNVTSTYYDQPKYLGKNIFDEVALPSYQLLDMSIKKKVALKNASFDFFLHGSNLLNEEARPQNLPLKYIAPLPGRGFQIGINIHL